jgi:hypothetical protein
MTSTPESRIDLFSMFKEDMLPSVRVAGFKHVAAELEDELGNVATPENVDTLNGLFNIKIVFNSHGDAINAGQTLKMVDENPFISFTEGVGDREIEESGTFSYSVENAFDMNFDGSEPRTPLYIPPPDQVYDSYGYWTERGLLSKGSMIANVDVRSYARRLLDALIGSDYDQQFLNQTIPQYELRTKPFEELIEGQRQRGQLIMHSNAVRELTSTKQVLETLMQVSGTSSGEEMVNAEISSKVRALFNERQINQDGDIPVNIIYGFGHHALLHVYKNLGINVSRKFASKDELPGPFKAIGKPIDQFFSAHPFGLGDETIDKYSRQLLLEAVLWDPIRNYFENGLVPVDHATMGSLWFQISRLARSEKLTDRLEDILEDFQQSPISAITMLEEDGVELSRIDSQRSY